MSPAIHRTSFERPDQQAVARQVQALVVRLRPEVTLERRRDERVPVPLLFRLTPLNDRREPLADEAITVVGKDISWRGLSFFHEQALVCRRAIIALVHPDFGRFAAEIDIHWCRFTKPGWYESGSRLVRLADDELATCGRSGDGENWDHSSYVAGDCCG